VATAIFVFDAIDFLLVFILTSSKKVDLVAFVFWSGVEGGNIFWRFTQQVLAPGDVFDVFENNIGQVPEGGQFGY